MNPNATPPDLERANQTLIAFALTLPNAVEEFPWGGQERVIKVNKKIFAFISVYPFPKTAPPKLRVGVKLPDSYAPALALPFTQLMGYGKGKARWVLAGFWAGATIPIPLLMDWIEESYGAIAPKSLVAQLYPSSVTSPASEPPTRPLPR